ncbi:alpha-amylase family glycosyl hydrolase [Haloarchaeobius amylolyticus]|uniref:alpha-amylase family glycosyl hydrolase n=1 Tax=Haloarchaeobius amylolyticus TaxID=1198296 RepID=UPI0026E58D79|nr:alpha-amylase family glycosyl hydrolase [Haloarchaeobius amylolyticus]
MHHPGPPRFTTVGEPVELAPRDPDPDAEYAWSLQDRPDESTATLDAGPVLDFEPDAPGTYRVSLDAPDGSHDLTVRAFPDDRKSTRLEYPLDEFPRDADDLDDVSVIGIFNEHVLGEDQPTVEDGMVGIEKRLSPGVHRFGFTAPGSFWVPGGNVQVPGPGRPKLRLEATVEDEEVVVDADATAAPGSSFADSDLTVEFYVDDRDGLDADALDSVGQSARVPRDALGDRARIHAVAVGERHSVPDVVDIEPADEAAEADDDSAVAVDHPNDPPEWLADATIYEIFVRSFAGERPPTTFEELERRLPYIESLGVDCIWLTPVLQSPTKHGYHITNFFELADDLGTREEFEAFVDAAHDRGMTVMFDLVINHSDREHPFFQMSAADVPEYRDWYVWEERADAFTPNEEPSPRSRGPGESDKRAKRYFNWQRIPNFNFESLAVRSHLLDVVDEWAEVVDGFRCDVAWGVPHGFWKETRERVAADHPDFGWLDETIPHDPDYHDQEFDAHYDTSLYYALRDIGTGDAPATAILDALDDIEHAGFPDTSVHMRYVENHDEDRYIDECGEAELRAAAATTFTLPGAPMIYAGQERGMTEYRGPMAWHDGDTRLTNFHRRLSRARDEHAVLREGRVERVDFVADSEDAVAFARDDGEDRVLVALHFGEGAASVTMGESVDDTDLVTGEDVDTTPVSDGVEVTVDDVLVLRVD